MPLVELSNKYITASIRKYLKLFFKFIFPHQMSIIYSNFSPKSYFTILK